MIFQKLELIIILVLTAKTVLWSCRDNKVCEYVSVCLCVVWQVAFETFQCKTRHVPDKLDYSP